MLLRSVTELLLVRKNIHSHLWCRQTTRLATNEVARVFLVLEHPLFSIFAVTSVFENTCHSIERLFLFVACKGAHDIANSIRFAN